MAAPTCEAELVAASALALYASLPANGKPHPRSSGAREWTVLAAIVLVRPAPLAHVCISLGTGLKVLPYDRLPHHGDVLHDSHAEVVARRGMRLWLADELESAAHGHESVLQAKGEGWALRDGWTVAMYVSLLPCGDASTYVLALAAPPSLAPRSAPLAPTLSTRGLHSSPDPSPLIKVYRGRNSYTTTSTLRTKPGRRDSPPSTSHSCSDKLAQWALVGLQGALLSSLHLESIKINLLVISNVPVPLRETIKQEVIRAIAGRVDLAAAAAAPKVAFSDRAFPDDRTSPLDASCPKSFNWVRGRGTEVVVNGIRQGASLKRNEGQPLGVKSRSRLCKLSAFERFEKLRTLLDPESSSATTYYDAKRRAVSYQRDKDAARAPRGPLQGWLVSGREFEAFRIDGTRVDYTERDTTW